MTSLSYYNLQEEILMLCLQFEAHIIQCMITTGFLCVTWSSNKFVLGHIWRSNKFVLGYIQFAGFSHHLSCNARFMNQEGVLNDQNANCLC